MATQHKGFEVTLTKVAAGKVKKDPVKLADDITVKASVPYVDGDAKATAKLYNATEKRIVDGFLREAIVSIQGGCRNVMLNCARKGMDLKATEKAVQSYVDERLTVGLKAQVSRRDKAIAAVKAQGLDEANEAIVLAALDKALRATK